MLPRDPHKIAGSVALWLNLRRVVAFKSTAKPSPIWFVSDSMLELPHKSIRCGGGGGHLLSIRMRSIRRRSDWFAFLKVIRSTPAVSRIFGGFSGNHLLSPLITNLLLFTLNPKTFYAVLSFVLEKDALPLHLRLPNTQIMRQGWYVTCWAYLQLWCRI